MSALLRDGKFLGDAVHTRRISDLVLADVTYPAGEHHCQEMHGANVASFNIEIGPSWQQRTFLTFKTC